MDSKKIFIANLSRGKVGETNASLLGGLIMTQFEIAALSRVDIPENEREDFFLYVDEFHDMITPSFHTILSQARKYHLNMTFANQYLGQLEDENGSRETLKAIFGNVGSVITFQTSVDDAEVLAKELFPVPEEYFPKLNQGQAYAKLYVQGDNLSPTFLSTLPPLFDELKGSSQQVIDFSRQTYGRPRKQAQEEIEKYFVENKITDETGGEVVVKKSRKRKRKKKSQNQTSHSSAQ